MLITGEGLDVPEYQTFKEELKTDLKKRGYEIEQWEEIQIGATIGVHTPTISVGCGDFEKM